MAGICHSNAGLVTAPHLAASEAGAEVLRAGGNAVEAMIAAAATIAVVYPHMNGIGGDGFWLIAEPGKPPRFIDACGPAGERATIRRYHSLHYHEMPTRGGHAAASVAGAIGGWDLAYSASRDLGGRIPLKDLVSDAVARAKGGIVVSRSQAALTRDKLGELGEVPGFADTFLIDGAPPEEGAILRLEKLADTLDHLSNAGLSDFYRGDVAAEIAADLERISSPVTRADLARYEARLRKPLSLAISGATLFNAPPPTQGLASLLILGLLDRLKPARAESFEHIHGLVEAIKRAFLVRDRVVADPDRVPEPPSGFLNAGWLEAEAAKIDMRRALEWPYEAKPGDTVWLGAMDRTGLAVSYIQSVYWEFGSGCVLPATGITWQNRAASFSLDPAALNALEPGRKPFHTLNPAMARLSDGRMFVYGTMGGEGQPQTQAQIFSRVITHGQELDAALDAPRFLLGRTWGDPHTSLRLENRFDPDVIAALDRAGHELVVLDEGYSDTMGHAGAILGRPTGDLIGDHDPRADGGAVAGG